jgi:hypothetical protein
MPLSDDTLLVLTGIGVPRYSARGLTQTLQPIEAAQVYRRSINGGLVDLSRPAFRKYKSQISASDVQPPACDGVWPGRLVTVECIVELSCPSADTPARTQVSGSLYTDNGFKFYRPQLSMMVTGWSMNHDEWGRVIGWTMDLEEA